MKWILPLFVLLPCALAPQARAESFHKCSVGDGAVAYRSQACLPGETLVATLEPAPEAHAQQPETSARPSSTRSAARHVARSRPQRTRRPRTTRDPCASAKKARDDFQRRRGIRITMDELSRWNHRVYDACK